MTRSSIIDAAIELLMQPDTHELSVRAVAQIAGMAERTVFRHFACREDLLDAVAGEMNRRQALPPLPEALEQLPDYAERLFTQFEATAGLTRAILRGEIYDRVRRYTQSARGLRIAELVDKAVPSAPALLRRLTAANLQYHLVASTWNYYRINLGFTVEETIAAACLAIDQALGGLEEPSD